MKFAITRILVPVDFSPHSELALRYATMLAGRLDALLEILHVVEEPLATTEPLADLPALRDSLIADAERQLDQYRPITDGSHVRTMTTIRVGQPAQTITAYARAAGIDLIVMGTHGRTGLTHLLVGSVAEHVMRHAPCPVLTLREPGAHEAIESVPAMEHAGLGSVLGRHGTSRE
jgi:nucleotide-binding universal stress UspA family protein